MMQYQLFDALTDQEFADLKSDIAQRGVLVPIELDETGNILDGHHRVRAWRELRAEGVKVGDYPRIVRGGMSEQEKRNHIRALNILRRHLSKDQMRDQMKQMRRDGATYEEIAKATGVSVGTAHAVASDGNFNSEITASDGRQRPPSYAPRTAPSVSIFANSKAEQGRAQQAASTIGDNAPDHMITTNRATRLEREQNAQDRANEPQEDITIGSTLLILGDMRERGAAVPDHSVDLVFTDPPYPEDALPLWSDLSAFCARVLKPSGMLVAYTGAMYLPDVLRRLGEHLKFWWAGSIILPGQHSRVFARAIAQGCKPLLFYVREGFERSTWIEDTYHSEGEDKDTHDWQQSIGAARYYLEKLTPAGGLVVDPFLGGGTTGLAAQQLGLNFIGIECDASAFAAAKERLNAQGTV